MRSLFVKNTIPGNFLPEGKSISEVLPTISEECRLFVDKPRNQRPLYDPNPLVTIINLNPVTFFVDSVLGDDNNPGTIDAPFKTLEKVNSLGLLPGDKVLFKGRFKGCLTVNKIATTNQPIIFSSYQGNKAEITTLVDVTDGINLLDSKYFSYDGSFETRELGEAWREWGEFIEPSFARIEEGDVGRYLHIYYSERKYFGIYQPLLFLKPGAKITFGFKCKGDAVPEFLFRFYLSDGSFISWVSGSFVDGTVWNELGSNSQDWTTYQTDPFVVPDNVVRVDLVLRAASAGHIYYDDVSVKSVWEQDGNYKRLFCPSWVSFVGDGLKLDYVEQLSSVTEDKAWYDNDNKQVYILGDFARIETTLWSHQESLTQGSSLPACIVNGEHIRVAGLHFSGGSRMKTTADPEDLINCVRLTGNHISFVDNDVGPTDGHAVIFSGQNVRVSYNEVKKCGYLACIAGRGNISSFEIENNKIQFCLNSFLDAQVTDGHAIGLFGGIENLTPIKEGKINSNLIENSGLCANRFLISVYNSEDVVVMGNKIEDNYTALAINVGTGSKKVRVVNNKILRNRGGVAPLNSSVGCVGVYAMLLMLMVRR